MIGNQYSLFNLLSIWKDNQALIHAHLQGHAIERYTNSPDDDSNVNNSLAGMAVGTFIVITILVLILWAWAVTDTIRYWNDIPDWAKIVAILGLVTGIGPAVTLIVIHVTKGKR